MICEPSAFLPQEYGLMERWSFVTTMSMNPYWSSLPVALSQTWSQPSPTQG